MRTGIKKITFSIVLFFTIQVASSQLIMSLIFGDKLNSDKLFFGIHMDESWNNMTSVEGDKALNSFNLGLFFNYKFNDRWRGNLEMLAKYKRGENKIPFYSIDNGGETDNLFNESKVRREISYLSIPMCIQYVTDYGLYFEFGPQVSYKIKAKDIFVTDTDEGELQFTKKIKKEVTNFDVGCLTGVGYYIGKSKVICLGVRYQMGFIDVMKNIEGNQLNRQWAIYSNIPIGRGKIKKNQ